MGSVSKQATLYLHKPETQYACADCTMFLAKAERCTIHGKRDMIKSYGSCGLFVKGMPMEGHPMGNVTKQESGYVEHGPGFSCKRCEYFDAAKQDCEIVDRDSPGDDPGIIHRDACCNAWEAEDEEPDEDDVTLDKAAKMVEKRGGNVKLKIKVKPPGPDKGFGRARKTS